MSIFGTPMGEAGGLKEGEDYILVNLDKNGSSKIKVYNLANPKYCKREGLIEVVATKNSNRHLNWMRISNVYDRDNDCYWGIPTGTYDPKTDRIQWKPIIVEQDALFDLTKRADAEMWAVLKNHYSIEGSPYSKGKPKYKVYDKEKDAYEFLQKDSLRIRAEGIARGLYGEELLETCRAAGYDVDSMSIPIMTMNIIKFAQQKPDDLLRIWDNPSRKELFVFKRGVSVGIIVFDNITMSWMYNGVILGTSEPQCVDYLSKNPAFSQSIDMFSKEKLSASQKSMASMEKGEVKIEDNKDAEIARLKKQIEELAKRQEQQLNSKKEDSDDSELKAMRDKAKILGIKGYHLFGKEKLAEAIKEAEDALINDPTA